MRAGERPDQLGGKSVVADRLGLTHARGGAGYDMVMSNHVLEAAPRARGSTPYSATTAPGYLTTREPGFGLWGCCVRLFAAR